MNSNVWLMILQIAAGGSLVQILVRVGAAVYKRMTGSEQRKSAVAADAATVETAADVLLMVRSELREVRAQHITDRAHWEALSDRALAEYESLRFAQAKENKRLATEIVRLQSTIARLEAELADLQRSVNGGNAGHAR